MNVYGRTRDERLAAVVESIAEKLEDGQECVPAVYRQAVGAEKESATPLNNRELHSLKMVEAAGIEPTSHRRRIMHPCRKCIAILCVPRIPRTAPLQVHCKRIALLCKKTMPYLCQTIWLPSSPPGPAYRTIRGRRSWPSSRLNKVSRPLLRTPENIIMGTAASIALPETSARQRESLPSYWKYWKKSSPT